MKQIALKFDALIKEGGIGAALFFVMGNLMYVNARSLYYLDGGHTAAWVPAVVGSVAYSITTVVVMRRPGHKALKIVFPIFDTLLVFLGYNIALFADGHLDTARLNPAVFALSIFFSLFTGFITYSLGMLNYELHETENEKLLLDEAAKRLESEKLLLDEATKRLEREKLLLANAQNGLENEKLLLAETARKLEDEKLLLANAQNGLENEKLLLVETAQRLENEKLLLENTRNEIENEKLLLKNPPKGQSNFEGAKVTFGLTESEFLQLKEYERAFLLLEKGRILKKKPENRTPDELSILERANTLIASQT